MDTEKDKEILGETRIKKEIIALNPKGYFKSSRGTPTIDLDNLQKVTPTAKYRKDHFIIFNAIGVTKSCKTLSRPLETKPGIPLKNLLQAVAVGAREDELFTSLASRLTRLDKQITDTERKLFGDTPENIIDEVNDALTA